MRVPNLLQEIAELFGVDAVEVDSKGVQKSGILRVSVLPEKRNGGAEHGFIFLQRVSDSFLDAV